MVVRTFPERSDITSLGKKPAGGSAAMETTTVTRHQHYLNVHYGLKSWLLTLDHKRIALLYLVTITLFLFIGGAAGTDDAAGRPGAVGDL